MIFLARFFFFFFLAVSGVILSDDDSSLYFSFFENSSNPLSNFLHVPEQNRNTVGLTMLWTAGAMMRDGGPRQVVALAVWTSRNRCKWLYTGDDGGKCTEEVKEAARLFYSNCNCLRRRAVPWHFRWARNNDDDVSFFSNRRRYNKKTRRQMALLPFFFYIFPPSYELGASRSEWHSHQQPNAWWRRDGTVAAGCGRIRIFAAGLNEKSPINMLSLSLLQPAGEMGQIFIWFWFIMFFIRFVVVIPQFSIRASLIDPSNTYILLFFFSLFSIYCGIRRETGECAQGRACKYSLYLSLFIRFQ